MGSGGCGRCITRGFRDWVRDKVEDIFGGSGRTGGTVGRMDSYDSDEEQASKVIKVQEALTSFRIRCENASDELERNVLEESREYMDNLILFLKEINEKDYAGQTLNINLQKVERESKKTEDIIHGYIRKRIQKKVSLDDEECKRVLSMNKGVDKEKAMTNFLNKVLKNALAGLIKEIKTCLNEQLENVEEQLKNRMDAYELIVSNKMKSFKVLEQIKESDEGEIEKKIIEQEYKYSLCEIGINLLEGK